MRFEFFAYGCAFDSHFTGSRQTEFLDESKCVERAIASTFKRTAARFQTRKPREMRTEKRMSV